MTYKKALELNESKAGLDLSVLSLEDLINLIDEIPGWDYPLADESMKELANRAGIDVDEYFAENWADYSDLFLDCYDILVEGKK